MAVADPPIRRQKRHMRFVRFTMNLDGDISDELDALSRRYFQSKTSLLNRAAREFLDRETGAAPGRGKR